MKKSPVISSYDGVVTIADAAPAGGMCDAPAGGMCCNAESGGNSSSVADEHSSGLEANWGDVLEFEMNLQDCPRATMLRLSVATTSGKEVRRSIMEVNNVSLHA